MRKIKNRVKVRAMWLEKLRKAEAKGVYLLKSGRRYYANDTALRRVAIEHPLSFRHDGVNKHYWLTPFAPKDAQKLNPLLDKRQPTKKVIQLPVAKRVQIHNELSKDNYIKKYLSREQDIKVTIHIDLEVWLAMIIQISMLVLLAVAL